MVSVGVFSWDQDQDLGGLFSGLIRRSTVRGSYLSLLSNSLIPGDSSATDVFIYKLAIFVHFAQVEA